MAPGEITGWDESDFGRPEWDAPIDVDALLARVPAGSTAKGIFFRTAIKEASKRTDELPGRDGYNPFSDYPVSELIEVLAASAALVYPGLGIRKALRLLGQNVYANIKDTVAGGFVIRMAEDNLLAAIGLTGRIYKIFSSAPHVNVTTLNDNAAVVSLRDVWTFPDAYHVGVFEGAIRAFGKQGVVNVRVLADQDVDLLIRFA